MQQVSAPFLAAVSSPQRQTAVEVHFGLYDTTAKADAVASATGQKYFSLPRQLVDETKTIPDYATLEEDRWQLSGKQAVFPEDTGTQNWGVWSDCLAGADGVFAQLPTVSFLFQANHSSVGLTLWFDTIQGDCAQEFGVTWYDQADNVLASHQVTNNQKSQCNVMVAVENYRRIQIVFGRMNKGYRYLRLAEVDFGVMELYDGQTLMSSNVLQEMDPLTNQLAAGKLTFTLDNSDRRFNILNPQGIYRFLQRRQLFHLRFGVLTAEGLWEWMDWGRYYLKEWENPNNLTTKLTAYDVLDLLDQVTYCVSPFYDQVAAGTILKGILDFAGIGDYRIDPILNEVLLTGFLGVDSCRSALHTAAVAAGATVRVDHDGFIVIEKSAAAGGVKGSLDYEILLEEPQIKQLPLVNVAEVTCQQYKLADTVQDLYQGTMPVAGRRTVWLSYQTMPAQATGVTVTGVTKESAQCYANGAYVTLVGNGIATIAVQGKTYGTASSVAQVATGLPAGETPQVAELKNNGLIGSMTTAQRVAERLLEDSGRRRQQTFEWWANPAYEVGDVVQLQNRYGDPVSAQFVRCEYTFNGGIKGRATTLGL